MSNKDNLFLHQLSWECPGLHGKGTRQDISRQTFAQVFEKYPKLIIPLFQRRYCWQESQFEGWWNDAYRGKRDHLGTVWKFHDISITQILCETKVREARSAKICHFNTGYFL